MKKSSFRKCLVMGIIILFTSTSAVSSINKNAGNSNYKPHLSNAQPDIWTPPDTKNSEVPTTASSGVNILMMVPKYFGALCHRVIDIFDDYGWNITLTGVTEVISACNGSVRYWNIPPLKMDYIVSEITDISKYDAVCIAHPSKWKNYPEYGNPAGDLIERQEALNLVSSASENGLIIAAWCAGVRVLAAADVITGKHVTGSVEYVNEYENAGAIYVSENSYPVVDGHIITVSGMRYILDMCEEIAKSIEEKLSTETMEVKWQPVNHYGNTQKQGRIIWNRTYGGFCADGGRSVDNTEDGGFIITGYTYSYGEGNADVYLIKTDESGNLLWQKTFGSTSSDCGNSVSQTSDGGYIVTGFTNNNFLSTNKDVYLIKTDAEGNLQWTKTFGGIEDDEGNSVCETNDGGYIIAGYTRNQSDDVKEIYLIKTDVEGNSQWTKTFRGSSTTNRGNSVCQTSDGGYLIAGSTGSNSAGYLIKTDQDGNAVWTKRAVVDNLQYSWGSSACELSDGNYIFAGHGRIGISDILDSIIEKRGPNGDLIWSRSFGESRCFDYGNSIIVTKDDKCIICGTTRSSVTDNDLYVCEIDTSNGNIIWKEKIGSLGIDCGKSVCITDEGNFVVVGYTDSFGQGNFDVWLIKISESENNRPNIPDRPIGTNSGRSGKEYSYSSVTTDSDGDEIFYKFDWGDGTDSGWFGPYNSGETAEVSHTWNEQGSYEIRAKAKDIFGAESGWSDPLPVSMPKNDDSLEKLRFFGDIVNNGIIIMLAFPTEFFEHETNYTFMCPGRGYGIWITPEGIHYNTFCGAVLDKDKFYGVANPIVVLGIKVI